MGGQIEEEMIEENNFYWYMKLIISDALFIYQQRNNLFV